MTLKKEFGVYKEPTTSFLSGNILNKQLLLMNRFLDMGFLVATSDSAIVLHSPIINYNIKKASVDRHEEYEENRKTYEENLKRNIKLSKKMDKRALQFENMFFMIKKVYPSFCEEMEKKIPEKDYNLYLEQKKKLRKIITKRNNSSDKKLSDELLEYKDSISEIIDLPDFSKACEIEDSFVVSELNKYFEMLKNIPNEERKEQNRPIIEYDNRRISTIMFANEVLKDRKNRIKKYEEILQIIDKLKDKKYIEITALKKNDEKEKSL